MRVKVTSAEDRAVAAHYVATGTVRGRNTAVLASKAMGYVKKLHVRPGDRVKKGDVLVELDARDARAEVSRARASIAEARASLAQAKQNHIAAKAGAKLAKLSYGRAKQLSEQNVVSQEMFDEADAKRLAATAKESMATAGLSTARARLSQARAAATLASSLLGHRKIVAPFSGRVVARSSETGDLAAPGKPLLELEEEGALRVEAIVDESQAGFIAIGNKAEVDVDAVRKRLSGQVDEIVPAVDVASRAFVTKIRFNEVPSGIDLRPGMFARVHFPLGKTKRLMVPHAAISTRGQLDRLFVVSDGEARLRIVTLGGRDGKLVEVLSGLDAGERVVAAPKKDLKDGAKIEATP